MRLRRDIFALTVIMLLTCGFQQVDARRSRPNNYHFWSLGLGAGYSTLLEDYQDLNTTGGGGADIHFGYEYEYQGFWVSPRIGLQYTSCNATSAARMADLRILDTQDKNPTMHYNVTSPLTEDIRFLYITIPVMVGYYSFGGFYIGAGFQLGINLDVPSTSRLDYTTSGTYYDQYGNERYFDDFENMPNHFYTKYTAKNDTVKYGSRFKVSVIGEIGYDIMASLHKSKVKYSALKIGAFVDYGLNNVINKEGNGLVCATNPNNVSQLIPLSYYSAHHTNNHRVVPLYAGVRVTWMFYVKGKNAYCPRCKRRWY